jgi:hypothetical protein
MNRESQAQGLSHEISMTGKFLIILSPPRSFSSVVSTMLGQHPELYGFPELHLFIGDTAQEVLDREYDSGNYFGPPGVLRTVAQLVYGCQTSATITKAIGWLTDRRHWSTKRLMDYFHALIDPLIGIEKSPVTALKALWIERAYAFYPDAYYLHLTRHPVSTRKSMDQFMERKRALRHRHVGEHPFDSLLGWYRFHKNIMDFTQTLPLGQAMRVKGEDILSEPDVYLPQIAEWLGVRADQEAIDAMKHPELSPYAYRGPAPAHGGNDPNFMRSPSLRRGRIKEPSLRDFLARENPSWISDREKKLLRESGYTLAPTNELIDEITGLSLNMGYQ